MVPWTLDLGGSTVWRTSLAPLAPVRAPRSLVPFAALLLTLYSLLRCPFSVSLFSVSLLRCSPLCAPASAALGAWRAVRWWPWGGVLPAPAPCSGWGCMAEHKGIGRDGYSTARPTGHHTGRGLARLQSGPHSTHSALLTLGTRSPGARVWAVAVSAVGWLSTFG